MAENTTSENIEAIVDNLNCDQTENLITSYDSPGISVSTVDEHTSVRAIEGLLDDTVRREIYEVLEGHRLACSVVDELQNPDPGPRTDLGPNLGDGGKLR